MDGAPVKSNMSSSDKIIAKSETQKKQGVGKENATQSKAIIDDAPVKSNISSTDEIIAAKVTGTVKRFNNKRGRGTITRTDTEKDIFVRRSSCLPAKILLVGEVVQFEIKLNAKGEEACNVTDVDGAPLKERKALHSEDQEKEQPGKENATPSKASKTKKRNSKEASSPLIINGSDGTPVKDHKDKNKEELIDTKEKAEKISGSETSFFETWFKKERPKSAKKKPV